MAASRKKIEDMGFAKLDHHRTARKGYPEVIFCPGKTNDQIARIFKQLLKRSKTVIATRATPENFRAVSGIVPDAVYHLPSRIISSGSKKNSSGPLISVITAGTSDIPVAEEAAVTAELLGMKVDRIFDVGVAGIHRLMNNLGRIKKSRVAIVVAGMEGALASVVGGLIEQPIIAVPTSIGYGANFKGLSALLTMLNSCAPGIATVNIDNGFGAACMANAIIRQIKK